MTLSKACSHLTAVGLEGFLKVGVFCWDPNKVAGQLACGLNVFCFQVAVEMG